MQIAQKIREKLEAAFDPSDLHVINDSHLHAGHSGDDGSGESHFTIEIASTAFEGLSLVERQRRVYQALSDEMPQIHALSMKFL